MLVPRLPFGLGRRATRSDACATARVIGVSLWSATRSHARRHHPPPCLGNCGPTCRANGSIVSSLSGLPAGVRTELQRCSAAGHSTSPTRPAFRATAETDSKLRRLVAAACSYDDCLVYYERGGSARMWRVVLFHWRPNQTRVEWGGAAPGGLTTIDDVRRPSSPARSRARPGPGSGVSHTIWWSVTQR